MFRKMLIAVDGTESSRHALEQGLNLAKAEEGEVLLTSVVPSYDGDLRLLGDKSALTAMREPYEQALEQARALAEQAGVRAQAQLLEGDPVEELLVAAEEADVDCIAVGKRGSYYSDLIPVGSVASKIIHLSEADVLLVPPHKEVRLHRILTPFDGSDHARFAAERAIDLSARYGSALYVATVYELPLEGFAQNPDLANVFHNKAAKSQKPIMEAASAKGLRDPQAIVRQGEPVYKAIIEMIREEDIGLVVMSNTGRGNYRLLLGKVSERVIGSGAAPVLLAKKGMK
jgi:nucleotide-binding universal stress UspA family protein